MSNKILEPCPWCGKWLDDAEQALVYCNTCQRRLDRPPRRVKYFSGMLLKNTVYVARPSRWGNPYPNKPSKFSHDQYSRDEALQLYEQWLQIQLGNDPKFLDELKGKNLACWCKPDEACHADILLRYLYGVKV